jgi:chromosome segregation ATPase
MLSSRFLTAVIAALPLLVFTALSGAQTAPAKQGRFGQGKVSGPLLTRTELRACFAQQERIHSQGEVATREREVLDREKADLVRQGEALKEQLAALDRSSQEAVDKYNAQAAERDRLIDAFEARMPAFNAKVEALQAERDGFAKRCENRRYDELDEFAIKRGK